MCKWALWLAPPPPACTPHSLTAMIFSISSGHEIHVILFINYYKVLYPWQRSVIFLDDTVFNSWFKSATWSCRRPRMVIRKLHSIKMCLIVNSWFPTHWSQIRGSGLFFITNVCIMLHDLLEEEKFSSVWGMVMCNLLPTSPSHCSVTETR